jgi:hypothetical protein
MHSLQKKTQLLPLTMQTPTGHTLPERWVLEEMPFLLKICVPAARKASKSKQLSTKKKSNNKKTTRHKRDIPPQYIDSLHPKDTPSQ